MHQEVALKYALVFTNTAVRERDYFGELEVPGDVVVRYVGARVRVPVCESAGLNYVGCMGDMRQAIAS